MLATSLPFRSLGSHKGITLFFPRVKTKGGLLLHPSPVEKPPAISPFGALYCNFPETSKDSSLWRGPSPIVTKTPDGAFAQWTVLWIALVDIELAVIPQTVALMVILRLQNSNWLIDGLCTNYLTMAWQQFLHFTLQMWTRNPKTDVGNIQPIFMQHVSTQFLIGQKSREVTGNGQRVHKASTQEEFVWTPCPVNSVICALFLI